MAFTLALAQCSSPADGNVLAQVDDFCARASAQDAQLIVFPEAMMFGRRMSAEELRTHAEPLDGPFVKGVAASARRHGVWVVFTLYEANPGGGRPFNTAAVVNDTGELCGSYQKCHLYDAHEVMESKRTDWGDALCPPLSTPFCTLGLGICYDLRFPEHAREAAVAGADLIVYPSAWYAGPHKVDHWKTLLRARAIENECFVAGTCRAGKHCVGHSLVAGPLGEVVAEGPEGPCEALVTATIDLGAVAQTRDAMPVMAHRRPELYGQGAKAL